MDRVELKVRRRTDMRRSHLRQLKAMHYVPGNVFGLGKESVPVEVDLEKLAGILKTEHGIHSLIDLHIEGEDKPELVVIKNLTKDPLSKRVQHVDLQRVALDKKVSSTVPIILLGHAKGASEGGLVDHVIREVNIRCLPDKLIDAIELDISKLEIGQHLCISDLPVSSDIEIIGHPEDVVVTIIGRHGVHAAPSAEPEAVTEQETNQES